MMLGMILLNSPPMSASGAFDTLNEETTLTDPTLMRFADTWFVTDDVTDS